MKEQSEQLARFLKSHTKRQQDAAQYSEYLLSKFAEVLSGVEAEDQFRSRAAAERFGGQFVTKLTCDVCQTSREVAPEPFILLPINLQQGQERSLPELLQQWRAEERMVEGNQVECAHCLDGPVKTDHAKRMVISPKREASEVSWPRFLALHLFRFQTDYQTMEKIKIEHHIPFEQTLCLDGVLDAESGDGPTYHLQSVVEHIGDSWFRVGFFIHHDSFRK